MWTRKVKLDFICSFNTHLLSTHHASGTVLSSAYKAEIVKCVHHTRHKMLPPLMLHCGGKDVR